MAPNYGWMLPSHMRAEDLLLNNFDIRPHQHLWLYGNVRLLMAPAGRIAYLPGAADFRVIRFYEFQLGTSGWMLPLQSSPSFALPLFGSLHGPFSTHNALE